MNPALAGAEPDGKQALEVAEEEAAAAAPPPLEHIAPRRRELSYLPERPPVDIEFTDLTYTVPQGRKCEY